MTDAPGAGMIAINSFGVDPGDTSQFLATAQRVVGAFAARPGYRNGWVGRAADDPSTWVLSTEWADVGSYRRALGSAAVRMAATQLLSAARNEPTAFEVLYADDGHRVRAAPSGRDDERAGTPDA